MCPKINTKYMEQYNVLFLVPFICRRFRQAGMFHMRLLVLN